MNESKKILQQIGLHLDSLMVVYVKNESQDPLLTYETFEHFLSFMKYNNIIKDHMSTYTRGTNNYFHIDGYILFEDDDEWYHVKSLVASTKLDEVKSSLNQGRK